MPVPTPKPEQRAPETLKPGRNNRPIVEDDAFMELVESIREQGILQPPAITEEEVIFGNRRVAAAIKAGLKTIPVLVYPAALDKGVIETLMLVENLQRLDQTDFQTYAGLKRLSEARPELQRQEIAKLIGKSAGMVTQYFSADSLCPEAMAAFRDGKIGITKVYKIATSPDQLATLAIFLNGGTRDDADRKARKARSSEATAVKAAKIKVPLVSGQVVTVAGEGVSMEEALDAVQEAAKKLKTAIANGITAKSAQGYWKDLAAAG